MLDTGFKVIISTDGDRKILLQKAFPELEFADLRGYRVRYSEGKTRNYLKIIAQIPKMLTAIKSEKAWLEKFVKIHSVDVIISDNRYGLYHPEKLSILITHQLQISTAFGQLADNLLKKLHYKFIQRFTICWVPDAPGPLNLGGRLSHPSQMPTIPVRYLGALSAVNAEAIPVSNKLLILLSGPEPQRTLLEEKLMAALSQLQLPATLVRGLPGNCRPLEVPVNVTVYQWLSGPELQQLVNASEIIVSRPGYSSLMDLLTLGKKCIFIPTPGQPEQQYLAKRVAEKGYACVGSQENFSLQDLLDATSSLRLPDLQDLRNPALLQLAIDELSELLEQRVQKMSSY